MQQQELIPMELEFPPNPTRDPKINTHKPPSNSQRHPKIKSLRRIHRQWEDITALRARKHRTSNLQAQDADPQNQNQSSWYWHDSPPVHRKVRFLKPLPKIFNLQHQLSQPYTSFPQLLTLMMRCLPLISALNLDFSHFWGCSRRFKRALLKILSSFKSRVRFDLLLGDTDKPATKLRYLRQLRGFQDLSLSLTSSSVLLKKSIIPSCLERLIKLRELNLTVYYLKDEGDEFIMDLALTLSKFSRLEKFHLKIPNTKVLQSSLIMLFQRFSTLKRLFDLSLNFSGCTMDPDNPDNESFAEYFDHCMITKFSLALFKNLNDHYLNHFLQILKNLTPLETLNFTLHWSDKMINGCLEAFSAILSAQRFLSSLRLEIFHVPKNNNIVKIIASALKHLQTLTYLELKFRNTHSDETQLQQLFFNLGHLKYLKCLCIWTGWNVEITNNSLETLGQSLQELDSLQSLSLKLYSYSATDQGGVVLASRIRHLSALKYLTLNFFETPSLTEKTLSELAQSLKILVHLRSVDFYFYQSAKMKNFEKLFKTLKGMKDLNQVRLWLPHCDQMIDHLDKEKSIDTRSAWPNENTPQATWGHSLDYQAQYWTD